MKVALFTSCSLRHQALACILDQHPTIDLAAVFFESAGLLDNFDKSFAAATLENQHLAARYQYEKDFFGLFLSSASPFSFFWKSVARDWFSSANCIDLLAEIGVDLILVYGSSIIRGNILSLYKNKILNMHLGLSPYYRGSGTNFFPFVNGEPHLCGTTFMFLDKGIDTGAIIHQLRPDLYTVDNFHHLSNRFLLKSFNVYAQIASLLSAGSIFRPTRIDYESTASKIYRVRDFNATSVDSLYYNFANGMIHDYLADKENIDSCYPIISSDLI